MSALEPMSRRRYGLRDGDLSFFPNRGTPRVAPGVRRGTASPGSLNPTPPIFIFLGCTGVPFHYVALAMAKRNVSLSVGRGEKLSVAEGSGLTAKGRAKYNRATGSNLKAPTKDKDNPRHKSFCARSRSWNGPRGKAARARWGC